MPWCCLYQIRVGLSLWNNAVIEKRRKLSRDYATEAVCVSMPAIFVCFCSPLHFASFPLAPLVLEQSLSSTCTPSLSSLYISAVRLRLHCLVWASSLSCSVPQVSVIATRPPRTSLRLNQYLTTLTLSVRSSAIPFLSF